MSDITYEPFPIESMTSVRNALLASRVIDEGALDGPNAERLLSVAIGVGLFLAKKNRAYGNSALDPVRVFSKSSAKEQLRVRIDDKLSRLMRGQAAGEDVEVDMAGYLILLLASREDT